MGGGTERAAVHLRQAESGVIGGDDDVGIADQADPAAEAVSVHGRDHRDLALVDGGEGGVATAVGTDKGVESFGRLHLLDVDAGVEAPRARVGPEDDDPHRRIRSEALDGVGQLEPTGHGERVDRRVVHDDVGDAEVVDRRRNTHALLVG